MSVQKILLPYKIAEAKGQIPAGTAIKATLATILEAGVVAFHKAFHGQAAWQDAATSARAAGAAGEVAGQLQESLLSDVSRVNRVLREAHTTTDFPIILQNLRQRIIRDSHNPVTDTAYVRRDAAHHRQLPADQRRALR